MKNFKIREFENKEILVIDKNNLDFILRILKDNKINYLCKENKESLSSFISKLYFIKEVYDYDKETENLKNLSNNELLKLSDYLENNNIGYDLLNNITSDAINLWLNK